MARRLAVTAAVATAGAVLSHAHHLSPDPAPVVGIHAAGLGDPVPFVPHPSPVEVSRGGFSSLPPLAPETTTTTTSTRTVPVPVRVLGPSWRDLVVELWGSEASTAFAVAWCESRDEPDASNPSGAHGLFQVMDGSFDPETNVREAFAVYRSRGWEPWDASRSCWAA